MSMSACPRVYVTIRAIIIIFPRPGPDISLCTPGSTGPAALSSRWTEPRAVLPQKAH